MNVSIVYDSTYRNTESLARAMGEAIGPTARVMPVAQTDPAALNHLDLLIVGSPTQGGKPTAPLMQLLGDVPPNGLRGTRVAAFDTRFAASEQGFGLRLLIKVIGSAAPRIARALEAKGGGLAAPPEGFIVDGKEGPLRDGELDRASEWALRLWSAVDANVERVL